MDRETLAATKFRPLKKAMQQTFREIRRSAENGGLPERSVVAEFVAQVGIMVSYPGFGEAAYPELQAAAAELADSTERADLERCRRAVAVLLALQERCHAGL